MSMRINFRGVIKNHNKKIANFFKIETDLENLHRGWFGGGCAREFLGGDRGAAYRTRGVLVADSVLDTVRMKHVLAGKIADGIVVNIGL